MNDLKFTTAGNYMKTNDRIQELAEQVYGSQATEQEIKFAELIVQECVYEIKMTMVRDGYDTKHYLQSRKHIEHICKHFGVEE